MSPGPKAIAHILGSLDDKIELNRRMNETLEAMAQALFKSWFVDFDPVIDNALAAGNTIPDELKEKAAIRQGLGDKRKSLPDDIRRLFPSEFAYTEEMGWIPKGWEVSKVGQKVEITGGEHQTKKMNRSGWSVLMLSAHQKICLYRHLKFCLRHSSNSQTKALAKSVQDNYPQVRYSFHHERLLVI